MSGNGIGLVKDLRLHRYVELHEAFLQEKTGLTIQTAECGPYTIRIVSRLWRPGENLPGLT
jgi:hypothetical protein